jgi:hypothetical protein
MLPSEKFGVASFPMSSAITNTMFGFVALLVPGSIGVSEGELQFKQKRGTKSNTIGFISLSFELRRSIQQKV